MNTTSTQSTSLVQKRGGKAQWHVATCGLMLLALGALLGVQLLASASVIPAVPLAGLPPTSAPNVQVLCVDDNGGASDAPCANPTAFTSIQAAVNAAVAGDEIRVAAGSYGFTIYDKNLTVRGGYAGGPGGWNVASPSNVVALVGNVSISGGVTITTGDFLALSNAVLVDGGTFNNTGTLTKQGAGAAQITSLFNNSGTVNIETGTLLLGFGNSAGAFNISVGATLEMCNCLGHIFGPASTIGGAGTFRVSGSGHVVSGTLTIPNLNIVGGGVNIDSVGANTASTVMTLTVAGTLGGTRVISVTNYLNWSGGFMQDEGRADVLPGAQMNITAGAHIAGREVNNYGTGTWSGGSISIGTGGAQPGTFNNQVGATFTILNDQTLETGGGSSFNNMGTITKQSAGTTYFTSLNNSGSLDVQSGLFVLGGGSSIGQFNVAAGATLNLCNCLTQTFEAGSSISGGGTLLVNGSSHTINGAFFLPSLTMSGGTFFINSVGANTASTVMTLTHTAGTLRGTRVISVTNALNWSGGSTEDAGRTDVLPGAQLNVSGFVGIAGRVLNNYGTGTWSGGSISIGTGGAQPGTFNNQVGATFTILNDQTLETGGGSSFNNMGTIIKQSSSGTTRMVGAFSNSGLVEVRSGTLRFECCPGATQTGGVTRMAGGNLQFDQPFQLQGGSLEGPGTVTGPVNNTGGAVSPGASPGLMTITGNYTQGAGGALNIELGGLTPVTEYDRLEVGGQANLDGTLNVTLIDGFVPGPGDSFRVMNYASRNGIFATYTGPPLTLQYNPDNLTLGDTNPTPTVTATGTPTSTPLPTSTSTVTATPTITATPTDTPTVTATPTHTGTPTNTGTPTSSPTAHTAVPATMTPTSLPTSTQTATSVPPNTATLTPSRTATNTSLPTNTPSSTPTRTSTSTATATPVSFVVTNANDSGPGSLHQALINANTVPGLDTITFNIPGSGVHRISVASNLPFITDGVIIDGLSQPGASGANTPLIELDGQNTAAYGLQLMASSEVRRLTINRFVTAGILLLAPNNVIRGCFIGTDATGTLARGNGYGVLVKGANNSIGVAVPDENARNVISGNLLAGVMLLGNGTSGNRIEHNYIGTDLTGSAAIGNGTTGAGVHLGTGSQSNVIGGTTPNSRNVISGHETGQSTGSGIRVEAQATSNVIRGNYIGADASGQSSLGNRRGIEVLGAGDVTIGGTGAGDGNLISGNVLGISLEANDGSNGSFVRGNLIGTNAQGTGAVGNSIGVRVESSSNRIGGTTPGARNIIAGNLDDGIELRDGASLTTIHGNYIGVTANGSALGNENGIRQRGGLFTGIGGLTPGSGNVISGNEGAGIVVLDGSVTILGNLIGTDPTGSLPLGNGSAGVYVGSDDATMGGAQTGAGNVISANRIGIQVVGVATTIHGNKIGTDLGGTLDLGNLGVGVSLLSSVNSRVGGDSPGEGNLIAFNEGGVAVVGGARNRITGNRMFANVNPQSNADVGIDLGDDGVTANDNCDPDTGANDLQNYPVLTSVITGTNAITITGSLNSLPTRPFRLHFYASQFCHPSGFGEGETYLGSSFLNVGGSCNASFSVRLPVTVPNGYFITSTATDDSLGNTSEFSACLVVGQVVSTATPTRTGTVTLTPSRTSTATGVPPTATQTSTAIATATRTATSAVTQTSTGVPPTATRTSTGTATAVSTSTTTATTTLTRTPTTPPFTATNSPTRTTTGTATRTPTMPPNTATRTATRTLTPVALPTCVPSWQQVVSPNPPRSLAKLNDVDVQGANDAWAVGDAGRQNWIIRWNGTSWSTVSSPRPDPSDGEILEGVSAISANDAWAVGRYVTYLPEHTIGTLTMHWDGSAWSVVQSPIPPNGRVYSLRAVSARASNDVWAVGFTDVDDFSSRGRPLAIRWDGAQWSITPMQDPGAFSTLNGVYARAANDVWAVGSRASLTDGSQQPLFYHWNGSQWTMQVGGQGLRQGTLYDVAALAANDVWAVGIPIDGVGGVPRPWVLRYNGQNWQEDTTIPQEVDPVQLTSVSASSPTNVWVVGKTEGRILRYHWNGSSWTRYSSSIPGSLAYRYLLGVDAIGANEAWTVGYEVESTSSIEYPYIERFSNACPPPSNTPTPTPTGIVGTPTPTPIGYIIIPGTATIVPGTNLVPGSQCNDCTALVSLPFRARLYDGIFSSARVGSNGTLGYVGNLNPAPNTCVPSNAFNYAILPHWDNLDTSSPSACNGPCGIYTSISGAAPSRIFNIEWRATLHGGSRFVNFQARVYENQNRTDLVYGALDPRSSHTIGAQRDTGSQVTRIYCDPGLGPEAESSLDLPDDWEVRPGMMLSLVQPDTGPTPTPTACQLQFSDVPYDHTFYPYIRCLACRGVVSGYADGTFRPGNNVTRGQITKIVSNAVGLNDDPGEQLFEDVPPGNTFYDFVQRLAVRAYMGGYPCGGAGEPCGPNNLPYFRPGNTATRGQVAKIISNAASFAEPGVSHHYADVPPSNPFYHEIMRLTTRGIVGGYPCGGPGEPCDEQQRPYFRWGNNVTRGQAAKMASETHFPGCSTP